MRYTMLFFSQVDAMFSLTVVPRFYETDAFRHVNNTVVAGWFETAREPLFRMFAPSMRPQDLPLILARIDVDFVAQIHYGAEVTIETGIEKIGNSSFVVFHRAWQNGHEVARGHAVQVHFDWQTGKSMALTAALRDQLETHLLPAGS